MKLPFAVPALVLALSVAGAAACGKDDPAGPSQPPAGGTATLTVTNSTQVPIYYIRIRTCGTVTWGEDLMPGNILDPGEGGSMSVPAGCRDVKVQSSNANGLEVVYPGVSFQAGQTVSKTVTSW